MSARHRIASLALLLCGGVAVAQEEAPYRLLDHRMLNSQNDPFKYYVDGRMMQPSSVLIGQVQSAVDASYQAWQSVACAYPTFESQGLSTNNAGIADPRDPYDVFNVSAIWVTSKSDPLYQFALGGGIAAAASIPLNYAGTLYQCDIYLNAVDFVWSAQATTPANQLDLQTFITHEIGHCIGLGHSEEPKDVMYPGATFGAQARALSQRDIDKVCAIAPQTGAVGSPCTTDPDCGSTALKCVAPSLPDGGTAAKLCSKGCTPTVPGACPDPFVCKPSMLISGSSGACLPTRGDFVTQVGAPCTDPNQCGSAVGECQQESTLPSGLGPYFKAGYCTQNCGAGSSACPAGSACLDFGGGTNVCFKTCRLGTGDCREGYSCQRLTDAVNVCSPSCKSNADCAGGNGTFQCRTCDGTCQPTQNPSATIGDGCQASSECGAGQFCLLFEVNNQLVGQCSDSCATSQCLCPPGSACHLLGNGERYCLKDCAGGGQCPFGFQCGLLPSGKACIPACLDNFDCPVGATCQSGQCTAPDDGSMCALCTSTNDAGTVTPKPLVDAGSGGGGSGGCGCAASPGVIALLVPPALFALLQGARRRRQAA